MTMIRCLKIPKKLTQPLLLPTSRFSTPLLQFIWHPQKLNPGGFTRRFTIMTENDRIEYNWIPNVEYLSRYAPGGYHPIMVGDVLHGRYHIADKLGSGGYSTVWLARDTHANRYVALKVNIADSNSRETGILKALSTPPSSPSLAHPGYDLVPHLLDEFKVDGPNGTHTCYTVAPAQGNLRDIGFSRLFPLDVARALSYRLVQAVAYLHSKGYAHGDIHLSNILVRLPSTFDDLSIEELYEKYGKPETVPITRCDGQPLTPNIPSEAVGVLWLGKSARDFTLSDTHLILSDFGEAFSPALKTKLGRQCCTPFAFRAPEATFEPQAPLSYPSDIWSLATAIWDIVGMQTVFSADYLEEDEVLSQHIDVLGPMPSDWWQRWEGKSRFFDESGHSTKYHKRNKWYPLDQSFETQVQKWRREDADEMQEDEKIAFLNMMRQMLMFRPEERLTVEQVLESEWMVKWALPDYQRS